MSRPFWRCWRPTFWDRDQGGDVLNYKAMWRQNCLAAAAITLTPLAILAGLAYEAGASPKHLWLVVGISAPLVLTAIVWGTLRQVERLRRADLRRVKVLKEIVYTHKMASIGRLAAGVAHEINNPLAIVCEKAGLITDLMEAQGAEVDLARVAKLVGGIQESAQRASAITHRLLSLGRHVRLEVAELDLGEICRGVLGFFERQAGTRGILMTLEVESETPKVQSDRAALEQIILNLLDNAFAVVGDEGEIAVAIAPLADGQVELSLTDDGPGIPPEDLKHVFEPFYSTKGGPAVGMGLSITYGIVHRLGGDIHVQSSPGRGTRFSIHLPVDAGLPGRTPAAEEEISQRALAARGAGD